MRLAFTCPPQIWRCLRARELLEWRQMFFEREKLTAKGRLLVLERLFEQAAARGGAAPEPGHVPVDTLHAYGEFETHARYLLEAAASQENSLARKARLKRLEKALNSLPDTLMASLPVGPGGNWLAFYRSLTKFLSLMDEAEIALDEDEYTTFIQKLIQMAGSVSEASAVKVDGASMFALMLIQNEMMRARKPKRKARRRKRKPAKATKHPKAS